MKSGLSVLAIIIFIMLGCGSTLGNFSNGKGRFPIQFLEDGLYTVSYKWHYVEKRYGKDRIKAVQAYLNAKSLIPVACTNGVIVLRGGEGEGGWAWAEFRCK